MQTRSQSKRISNVSHKVIEENNDPDEKLTEFCDKINNLYIKLKKTHLKKERVQIIINMYSELDLKINDMYPILIKRSVEGTKKLFKTINSSIQRLYIESVSLIYNDIEKCNIVKLHELTDLSLRVQKKINDLLI